MIKNKISYRCNGCGIIYPRWHGQCSECNKWNSIVEVNLNQKNSCTKLFTHDDSGYSGTKSDVAVNPSQIISTNTKRFETGILEFDRVMGGGLTIGSATLFSGGCGAGKTTLVTTLSATISHKEIVLYATGEENQDQWKSRQKRVAPNYNNDNLFILPSGNLDDILNEATRVKAKFLIVDSIQAIVSSNVEGSRGSPSQVKECGSVITEYSKRNNVTSIIIGQVTKNNSVAGPKVIEHTIDTHIHLEKSEYNNLRTLRSMKNRFGSEETVGLFKMEGKGMVEITDPSIEFRSSIGNRTSGCSTTCLRSDNRNILIEIQSLVVQPQSDKLQRVCIGVNHNRVQLITAILRKHCNQNFFADIFISVVGGLKLSDQDTSSDLAIAAALISSNLDKIIDEKTCFIAELTLSGEIKSVSNGESRVEEAIRHGFNKIYISQQLFEQIATSSITDKLVAIPNIKDFMSEF